VQDIDTTLVMRAIEPLWRTRPETASRVRGRIEAVLDWAKVNGFRDGENPARWRGHLNHLLPARSKVRRVKHHPALPYSEVPAFVAELRKREGAAARALEFLILTATRTGELLGASWDEFELANGLWTVPADRMKAGREHRVPLSHSALEILRSLSSAARPFPLSSMTLLMLLRRLGRSDVTAHGFRSSFRDWAAERTNFPNEVVEMALAHTVADAVEAAYRRGDLFERRRSLMADWARYCNDQSIATGTIVPLQAMP
jgi:integrase